MNDLKTLTEKVVKFRNDREWKKFHTPKDMVLSLLIEAGELAEHFQWKSDQELQTLSQDQREAIGLELADVLYWVLLLSHDLGINPEESFQKKQEINNKKYPVNKARGSNKKYSEL